ncbi:MAG: hypothetical protein ABI723_26465 [Bacteroidia bacterium]
MNLHSKKLEMIHQLINIDDEIILEQVKAILNNALSNDIKPMNLEEFYKKIDESEKDFANGNYITTEQLKKEILTWKKR